MLVSEAVTAGYRAGNIVAAAQTLVQSEIDEGVALVNELWQILLGHELGENLLDWPLPPAFNTTTSTLPEELPFVPNAATTEYWLYPVQNSRLLTKITAATTVYFPAAPDDGARMSIADVGSTSTLLTLNGNGRLVEGATLIVIDPSASSGTTWFYRADLGSWSRVVVPLLVDDDLPLPGAFNVLFTSYLAINLAPRNSQAADPVVVEQHRLSLARLKSRYRQQQAYKVSDPRLSESTQSGGFAPWFF